MEFGFGGSRATGVVDSYKETVDLIRHGESLGFGMAFFSDSVRDCYSQMAVCAMATTRIRLGVGVTNPYSRHPFVTARTLATIDEISNGRAILGMGTGDIHENLKPMGYRIREAYSRVGEAAYLIRRFIKGENVTYQGKFFQVKDLKLGFKSRADIPIFIAGNGSKIMYVAGSRADGVIIPYFEPSVICSSSAFVRQSAVAAGRSPDDIKVYPWGPIFVTGSKSEKSKMIDGLIEYIAAGVLVTPENWLIESGKATREQLSAIKESYVTGSHNDPSLESRMHDRMRDLIGDDLIEEFTLIGSADELAKRIEGMQDAGVAGLVSWIGARTLQEKKKQLDGIAAEIMPLWL